MKKLLFLFGIMVSLTITAGNINLKGVWVNGNIEITFLKDTIMMDEVGNEGYGYTYTIDDNVITLKNELDSCDSFAIEVVELTDTTMSIRYLDSDDDKVYGFKKKQVQIPTMGY